jgi:hypothetical protein
MPSPTDLGTVTDLKRWLSVKPSGQDEMLAMLVATASGQVYEYLQRGPLTSHAVNLTVSGNGKSRLLLPEWPVTSVQSVTLGDRAVQASTGYAAAGWTLDPWNGLPPGTMQMLRLNRCGAFWGGDRNVVVQFTAGYLVSSEAQTVPAVADPGGGYTVQVAAPNGPWAADGGVTYAMGGAALVPVTGVPVAGQYQLAPGLPGRYVFAATDEGKGVLVSYSYIPSVLRQACMEVAAERYVYRSHIGERAVTTQGVRTTSFAAEALSPHVKAMLDPYRRVVWAIDPYN